MHLLHSRQCDVLKLLLESGADLYAMNNVSKLLLVSKLTCRICVITVRLYETGQEYSVPYNVLDFYECNNSPKFVNAVVKLNKTVFCHVLIKCYYVLQEGNTPYSLALSGQDSDTANFVMTYASKSPQKQDTGPSQMTIYDLQVFPITSIFSSEVRSIYLCFVVLCMLL